MRVAFTRHVPWAVFGSLFLAAFVWACSDGTDAAGDQAPEAIVTTTGATTPTVATVPTDPNLKVAFIGDTGTGNDFRDVLRLIKREGADLVVIQGDLNYELGGSAAPWFDVADAELDVPYFVAKVLKCKQLEGARRLVRGEFFHVRGFRGKASERETQAARERAAVGFGGGRERVSLQGGEDEVIEFGAAPRGMFHSGHSGWAHGLEAPPAEALAKHVLGHGVARGREQARG